MPSHMMKNAAARQLRRTQGYANTAFWNCLGNLPPTPPKSDYQQPVIDLMEGFKAEAWYEDPVQTVIDGKVVEGGAEVLTVDAFFKENGKMIHADAAGLAALKKHLASIDTSTKDYREAVRKIEDEFTGTTYGPELIANQAMDYKKQDGFTEIEEWIQAAMVERRMNDLLLEDEAAGKINVLRTPAFIGCVSNFSNFLDLSKKTLRNLEVGVPVVVLSRSNTTQHMYRWFQRLTELMAKHGIPQNMATYASLDVAGQRDLLSSFQDSPMYFTGSREVAELLKEVAPNLMASTAGPNTMVVTELNDATRAAACISSTIENAGQCTHMRHLVAPNADLKECEKIYDNAHIAESPLAAIKDGFRCDGFLAPAPTSAGTDPDYTKHPTLPAAYRVSSELPPDTINEKWREGFIDVTSPGDAAAIKDPKFVDSLAQWIVRNGPITLAVNGDDEVMRQLFEKTGLTVYTVGDLENPGLTVSARPQESEAFGEFPARPTLQRFTKFPVLVPSSAPAYHTQYDAKYLAEKGAAALPAALKGLDTAAVSATAKGYVAALHEFLADACGAKNNLHITHARTAVSGWQRPPLNGAFSVIRADATTSADAFAVYLAPYLATNAKECLYISVDPANAACVELANGLGHAHTKVESEEAFQATAWEQAPWNVQVPKYDGNPATGGAPLPGPFLALLLAVGHIKCLQPNNKAFADKWSSSKKWLSMA